MSDAKRITFGDMEVPVLERAWNTTSKANIRLPVRAIKTSLGTLANSLSYIQRWFLRFLFSKRAVSTHLAVSLTSREGLFANIRSIQIGSRRFPPYFEVAQPSQEEITEDFLMSRAFGSWSYPVGAISFRNISKPNQAARVPLAS